MQGAECVFLPQSEAQRGRVRRSRGLENPLHLLGRGDPQQDAIFSALLAQAFDDRGDSVFEPELCAEDGVEVRDYVITGLDRGTAVNDRSALLHPAHAIADTHFDAGLLRRRFTLPLMAGVVTTRSSPSRAIHTGVDTAFPDLRNVVSEIKRSSPRAVKARGRLMLPGYRGAARTPRARHPPEQTVASAGACAAGSSSPWQCHGSRLTASE